MTWRNTFAPPPAAVVSDQPARWVDGFVRSLIQHAARNAPSSLSERLEEEWLADLAERRGQMARLRFGIGCCWATRVIAHEYSAPKVLAAVSATGNKVMTAYAQHDYSLFSRRSLAFVLIVGVHGVLILVLANGLGHNFVKVIPTGMQIGWVPEVPKNQPPPLPPPPTFRPHVIDIPPTDDKVDLPPDDGQTIQQVGPEVTGAVPPPTTPPITVNRVLGGPGKTFPNTDDFYPFEAKRRGEKGVATVRTCVDDKGRLTAVPTLAETSGSASLDEGALKLAKAGSGHYRATTEDGRPVSSCYQFRIRFNFKE
ncbi:MAG: energy transducer TonB [Gammaproteobacteria bacterium]|nr:energy transducer TonB [Gammaproteobacteria bacterium]